MSEAALVSEVYGNGTRIAILDILYSKCCSNESSQRVTRIALEDNCKHEPDKRPKD